MAVAMAVNDVSEERVASIFRVEELARQETSVTQAASVASVQ
jgi:hypothetical protein